jgi:hypothetical protein
VDENIITFNFTNWVTVLVMAFAGYVVFSLIAQTWHKNETSNSVGGA